MWNGTNSKLRLCTRICSNSGNVVRRYAPCRLQTTSSANNGRDNNGMPSVWVPEAYRGVSQHGSKPRSKGYTYQRQDNDGRNKNQGKNRRSPSRNNRGRSVGGRNNHLLSSTKQQQNHHKHNYNHAEPAITFRQRRQRNRLNRNLDALSQQFRTLQNDDLVRIVTKYRSILDSETHHHDLYDGNDTANKKVTIAAVIESRSKGKETGVGGVGPPISLISSALQDLHVTDTPVTWDQLHQSEDLFRALCRTLQELTNVAAQWHLVASSNRMGRNHYQQEHEQQQSHGSNSSDDPLLAADKCLRHLILLRSDRALLVDRLLNATQYPSAADGSDNILGADAVAGNGNNTHSPMKNWVASLLLDNNRATAANQATKPPSNSTVMAHQDTSLGVTQELFGRVIGSLAATASEDSQGPSNASNRNFGTSEVSLEDGISVASITARMVQMIDSTPAGFVPSLETIQTILEWLCRVGTLESARTSRRIFQRYPDRRLRFGLVLEAYLEACRRHRSSLEGEITDEVLEVLEAHWKEHYPRHRIERIANCATVLHCLVVGVQQKASATAKKKKATEDAEGKQGNDWIRVHRIADELVQKTVNAADYGRLQALINNTDFEDDATSDTNNRRSKKRQNHKQPDAHLIPILNFLSQLYAHETTAESIAVAARLLDFIMEVNASAAASSTTTEAPQNPPGDPDKIATTSLPGMREITGKTVGPSIYPNTETFDALFEGTTRVMQGQSKKLRDEHERLATLDYCTNLLQFMYLQDEPNCWPGSRSFDWMLLLIRSVKPVDVGERGVDMMDMLEVRQAIDHSHRTVQIKHYHHALVCWHLAARFSPPRLACQKALDLLTRMENQSIPLLLEDRDFKKLKFELYNRSIRPTKKTYRMVLDACFHSPDEEVFQAVEVASQVYHRMLENNIRPDTTKHALGLAVRLPVGCKQRQEFETLVLSTLKDED